ncbi:EFR1 family ferrodoxin [Clostridium sp. YIM B02500]|uniref:EFR1 family ferrodoxin n=1 Tax=Clostridium sp. YIM B02500 TaxID=2910681 RepID=UPI001EED2021|nr:EFR1 family ferrodoxin [Clostridium sp. YIM B02500]
MIIEEDTILYFSGTGNSLQVANDIARELGNFNLCKITSLVAKEKIKIEGKTLGIVFPVIYNRLPLVVERIMKNLEINKDTYVFAVATHGGTPAEVLNKLKKLLQNNNIMLNSGFLIHMPLNNIFAFGSISIEKQNKIFQKERYKVKHIAHIVAKHENYKSEVSPLIFDTLIDKIFIKTTDKIVKNLHLRDKDFWVDDNCNGCRLCEKICPVNNIQFNINKPIWKHNCEQCAACIQYCPKEAIQWRTKTKKRRRYRNPNISINELIGY